MSDPRHAETTAAIGLAISRWQDAVEAFDGAVSQMFGLSAPERRCVAMVCYGPQSASTVARAVNLTPAAVTTLIDRLEARGFVRRQADPNDRRKVLVAAAEQTQALVAQAYRPVYDAGAALLADYTLDEMRLILTFVESVEAMQAAQTERLRATMAGQG